MQPSDDSGSSPSSLRVGADGGVSLQLRGEIDVTNADQVEASLKEATREGPAELLLDLRAVTFLDTAGLRLILLAHRWQTRAGHALRIVLAEGENAVRRVLETSGLLVLLGLDGT
jgi:anti-sigma B factor antagonist